MSAVDNPAVTSTNVVTFIVYGALGGALFLLPIELQQVSGDTALQAGVSLLPVTAIMLALSARSGALAARIGPRLQMSAGPAVIAIGLALFTRIGYSGNYFTAALIVVAVLPAAAGLAGTAYLHLAQFSAGFGKAMLISAGLCLAGGALAAVTIRNPHPEAGAVPQQLSALRPGRTGIADGQAAAYNKCTTRAALIIAAGVMARRTARPPGPGAGPDDGVWENRHAGRGASPPDADALKPWAWPWALDAIWRQVDDPRRRRVTDRSTWDAEETP